MYKNALCMVLLSSLPLAAHAYSIESMTMTGTAVTAVPEAETYAMLLAGLGLVGFAVRRRKVAAR